MFRLIANDSALPHGLIITTRHFALNLLCKLCKLVIKSQMCVKSHLV